MITVTGNDKRDIAQQLGIGEQSQPHIGIRFAPDNTGYRNQMRDLVIVNTDAKNHDPVTALPRAMTMDECLAFIKGEFKRAKKLIKDEEVRVAKEKAEREAHEKEVKAAMLKEEKARHARRLIDIKMDNANKIACGCRDTEVARY